MARANYVQEQEALKRNVAQKKAEKESSKLIEEMIYGAPRGGEPLVRFMRVLLKTEPISGCTCARRLLVGELQGTGWGSLRSTAS